MTTRAERVLNILHISDLHFGSEEFDQSVVLEAFKRDLNIVCQGATKPDLVIFSGDVAQSADEPNIYYSAYEKVLEDITSLAGCSEQRLILCPGNHDAHRKFIELRENEQRSLSNTLADRERLNQSYLSGELAEFAKGKFQAFREIAQYFGEPVPAFDDGIVRLDQLRDLDVDVVTLNSASMTSAGLKAFPGDEHRLVIPEAAIVNVKKLLRPAALKILVHHHPMTWLSHFNQKDFSASIDGAFDLRLSGHLHEVRPEDITTSKGACTVVQAGALYQGRDRYNGYCLISFDPTRKFRRVHARSYFKKTGEFDAGVDVLSNKGIYYSSDESRSYWRAHSLLVDSAALGDWVKDTLLPAAQPAYNESISDHPVDQVFVAPPMHRKVTTINEKGLPEREEIPITMHEILSGTGNLIIYGRQDHGKTTLLQQIAIGLMKRNTSDKNPPTVPIVIDFSSIKPGDRPVARPLNGALPAELPDISINSLLESGYVTVLVDDVEFGSKQRWSLLKEFVQKFPRNRFIFSSTPNSFDGVLASLSEDVVVNPETPQSFEHVFLQVLSRSKMRHLVKRWDADGRLDQEAVLNRLVSEMTSMNIPFTAVNGTILLTIFEQKSGFKPVNRAALIEQFVEFALEKGEPEGIYRGALDFRNKEFLLSELAGAMVSADDYILPSTRVVEIIRNSLNAIGLRFDVEAVVRYFLKVGILRVRGDDCISFRYRAFLEYFVACRMRDSAVFRSWVFEEQRYLRFLNETLYYAGLVRNDDQMLEMIAGRFHELNERVESTGDFNSDLTQIANFVPPVDDGDGDIFDDFSKQMDLPPFSEEVRDSIMDGEIPHDIEDRQEVFRPMLADFGQQWTISLLLYSGVLKNLELIPDETKRKHLRKILHGWGNLTAISLTVVPQLARSRGARINGVTYEVIMPKHFSEQKVARLIYLDMPRSVSQMLFGVLGTEKLDRQLTEPELIDAHEPLITQFYRSSLIGLLKLSGWTSALHKLSDDLQERSNYLAEALLRSLSDMYFLGGHKRDDEKELLRLLGESSARLRGPEKDRDGKQLSSSILRSDTMQYARKRALLRRVRAKAIDAKDES